MENLIEMPKIHICSFANQFSFSISPKNVMIIGISAQIIFGNLTGLARIYELHIIFKCLTAASCALMYTAGSAICEFFPICSRVFFA